VLSFNPARRGAQTKAFIQVPEFIDHARRSLMAISSQRKFFLRALSTSIGILALTIVASAQDTANQKLSANLQIIRIENFGQMDERFYRGAQPSEKDYKDLAALGINTVIDLRDDPATERAAYG